MGIVQTLTQTLRLESEGAKLLAEFGVGSHKGILNRLS
jgi:hypothetical protein